MVAPDNAYFITSILQPQKLIYTRFLRPASHEEYKAAMLDVFSKIQKNRLTGWVMVSSVSDFTMQDQKWSVEQLGLLLQGTPLRKVAMVRGHDAILQVVAESMRAKIYGIYGESKVLQHFATLEEALQFLVPGSNPETLIQAIGLAESK